MIEGGLPLSVRAFAGDGHATSAAIKQANTITSMVLVGITRILTGDVPVRHIAVAETPAGERLVCETAPAEEALVVAAAEGPRAGVLRPVEAHRGRVAARAGEGQHARRVSIGSGVTANAAVDASIGSGVTANAAVDASIGFDCCDLASDPSETPGDQDDRQQRLFSHARREGKARTA
jgi:hypothetical protein